MLIKKYLQLIIGCLLLTNVIAQPKKYTTANAHSHNDYEQAKPFFSAYTHQFGSIEVDVFYVAGTGKLLVGHELSDIRNNPRTLDSMYLVPIVEALRSNNDHPYADITRELQLMIDLKTPFEETLSLLVNTLKKYPSITQNKQVHIVISGNRPDPKNFHKYPSYIQFDGNLSDNYTTEELRYIKMISASFGNYSKWNGEGTFPATDKTQLKAAIDRAHAAGKKVRLWAIPDQPYSWKIMTELGVDFINTDKIEELAAFLK